jgi:hypothetical protein
MERKHAPLSLTKKKGGEKPISNLGGIEFLAFFEPSLSFVCSLLSVGALQCSDDFAPPLEVGSTWPVAVCVHRNQSRVLQKWGIQNLEMLPRLRCPWMCHHRSAARCPPQRRVVWNYLRAHAEHAVDYGRGFSDFLILT